MEWRICWKFNFWHHHKLVEPSWVGSGHCFACNCWVGSGHMRNSDGRVAEIEPVECRHLWAIHHSMKVMLTMMWSRQYNYCYSWWHVLSHPSWSNDLFASPVYSHRDQGRSYCPYASAWQCQWTILLHPNLLQLLGHTGYCVLYDEVIRCWCWSCTWWHISTCCDPFSFR